jgi:hypothetical protein
VNVAVKTEIAAAVTLGQSFNGQRLSINEFSNRFGLSSGAREAIASEIKNPTLLDERFQFDASEFAKQVPYRSIELNTGVIVTADATRFDEVIKQEVLVGGEGKVRLSAEGKVMNDKLTKAK